MTNIEREALEVVCARWRLAGLAGPSVAHAEGIIAALNKAGMLVAPTTTTTQGAVRALELLLPWADGPDEDWMRPDDIARRAVALRMARDIIEGQ